MKEEAKKYDRHARHDHNPRDKVPKVPIASTAVAKHAAKRRTSQACDRCRICRTKCTGGTPCSNCANHDAVCAYSDGKREQDKRALKESVAREQVLQHSNAQLGSRLLEAEASARLLKDTCVRALDQFNKDTDKIIEKWSISEDNNALKRPHSEAETNDPQNHKVMKTSAQEVSNEEQSTFSDSPRQTLNSTPTSVDTLQPGTRIQLFPTALHHLQSGEYLVNRSQQWHPALRVESYVDQTPVFQSQPDHSDQGEMVLSNEDENTGMRNQNSHDDEHLEEQSPETSQKTNNSQESLCHTSLSRQLLDIASQQEWAILPLSFDDGSPASKAYIAFWRAGRFMLQQGAAEESILGGPVPVLNSYFDASRRVTDHSISTWACTLVSSFTDFEEPVRLAAIFFLYRLMRWLIVPRPDTYLILSAFERPTLAQRLIPHCAWIDIALHPDIRTALCQRPRDWLTLARETTLNWPGSLSDAVNVDPVTGTIHLSDAFERHILDLSNWGYRKTLAAEFPELIATQSWYVSEADSPWTPQSWSDRR